MADNRPRCTNSTLSEGGIALSLGTDPSDHEYVESFLNQVSSNRPIADGAEKRPRPFN